MNKVYLVGPPGAGKTTRLVERLTELVDANIRPDRILVLVPQQAQARAFRATLAQLKGQSRARGEPDITTLYGLAQQHVSLYFPLIAGRAGFAQPQREPAMLNVEATQFFLDRLVEPRLADFDDLKLFRPRLLGQILDSMNKAAECGFGLDEIAMRLSAAWSGESQRLVSFQRVQDVALDFRRYCLEHSLLDFSLQIDTFAQHLLKAPTYQDYITARYRHVIADNLEENPPVMHDFLAQLLQTCDSALLAEDDPGGYRIFLGADVQSARTLRADCDELIVLDRTYTGAPEVVAFGEALSAQFEAMPHAEAEEPIVSAIDVRAALGDQPGDAKYWTGMVSWIVDHITTLVEQGVPPKDIAVLAPYVEDMLRFELQERLQPH
ncbi:MAG TPA: UvrD-helicase domain-containing protein, partial [Anaerolineae bacterium]